MHGSGEWSGWWDEASSFTDKEDPLQYTPLEITNVTVVYAEVEVGGNPIN